MKVENPVECWKQKSLPIPVWIVTVVSVFGLVAIIFSNKKKM